MLVDKRLVTASVARARRSRFHPAQLSEQLDDGTRARRTSSDQRGARYAQLLAESGDPEIARTQLERLIGGNDLVSINYLDRGSLTARSICRIRLRNQSGDTVGFGTGFLIAPHVLLTNHHVISTGTDARFAQAEFDYELDVNGAEKLPAVFSILDAPPPIAVQELDFCIAAVADRSVDGKRGLGEFGCVPLNPAPGKAFIGEYLTIIQHPNGERKQVCVRENKLLKFD